MAKNFHTLHTLFQIIYYLTIQMSHTMYIDHNGIQEIIHFSTLIMHTNISSFYNYEN